MTLKGAVKGFHIGIILIDIFDPSLDNALLDIGTINYDVSQVWDVLNRYMDLDQ